MQENSTLLNIILGIAILVLMGANFFVRKVKMERSPLGRVVTILDELRYNGKLIGSFSFHRTIKKFRTKHWKRNRNKIDFIPQEILSKLAQAFDLCEDVNSRIESARKYSSNSYMASIEISKLQEPVTKSQEALREWLQANMDNPIFQQKRRGLFGSLFGGGGGLFGR